MAFTPNYQFQNPTPGDPAFTNVWGTTENTGRTLVDTALGAVVSLSVAGAANVVLTSTAGTPDQSRNMHYILTGVLTGDVVVLWPQGLGRSFSVINSTTGPHTLSCGANNGSGSPAGTTILLSVSIPVLLYSDGTNVAYRVLRQAPNRYTNFGTFSPANYSTISALPVMTGNGGAWTITPASTGNIRVRATATLTAIASALPSNGQITINYGTGTAPAQGDASTGTPGNSVASTFAAQITGSNSQSSVPIEFEITGKTLGTALWFDGALASSNGATTMLVNWQGIIIEEF